MNASRRDILRRGLGLGAASAAVALLAGCESLEQRLTHTAAFPPEALPPPGPVAPAARLLDRAAYGPRPGQIAQVEALGISAWVEQQLHPETIAEDPALLWRLHALGDTLDADPGLLFDQDDRRVVAALRQATLLRAVFSRRPLAERLAGFWSDHFNVYAYKGAGAQWKILDDRETIRPHVLGRFRDLLGASARSAAMLGYLDNDINRKGVPNENYARELMELHTLGVDGGYTQADVREVARCLTGWTSERHWRRGRFLFDPTAHDDGAKQVLGRNLPAGGGVRDGERVLDLLAAHPATARHLARKLCRFFLGDENPEWVARLTQIYRTTGGNIKALLRPLLTWPGLAGAPPIFKRPLDFAAGALRALGVDTDGGPALQDHLEKMGQPLFGWPMPDGFPSGTRAWTGTLVPRWNFALALAGGRIENTRIDWDGLVAAGRAVRDDPHRAALDLLLPGRDNPARHALLRLRADHPDPAEYMALLLMSPPCQWR